MTLFQEVREVFFTTSQTLWRVKAAVVWVSHEHEAVAPCQVQQPALKDNVSRVDAALVAGLSAFRWKTTHLQDLFHPVRRDNAPCLLPKALQECCP